MFPNPYSGGDLCQLPPEHYIYAESPNQSSYQFDDSPDGPHGLSFTFDNSFNDKNTSINKNRAPIAKMGTITTKPLTPPSSSRRHVHFQSPQNFTAENESTHFHRVPTSNNQGYYSSEDCDKDEDAFSVQHPRALVRYDTNDYREDEGNDHANSEDSVNNENSTANGLFLASDDGSDNTDTIYPHPNMSAGVKRYMQPGLNQQENGPRPSTSNTNLNNTTAPLPYQYQTPRFGTNGRMKRRCLPPPRLPISTPSTTPYTTTRKRPSPEHDPENHLIKRLRTESRMAWADIVKILNDDRADKGGPPGRFTEAAVYGRFVRNAPRIAIAEGDVKFDVKDWMHLRPAKKDEGSPALRGTTGGFGPNVGKRVVGGESRSVRFGGGRGGVGKVRGGSYSMRFEVEDDAALVEAYNEAYEELEGRLWAMVAGRLDEKCGKGFDAQACANRYKYL